MFQKEQLRIAGRATANCRKQLTVKSDASRDAFISNYAAGGVAKKGGAQTVRHAVNLGTKFFSTISCSMKYACANGCAIGWCDGPGPRHVRGLQNLAFCENNWRKSLAEHVSSEIQYLNCIVIVYIHSYGDFFMFLPLPHLKTPFLHIIVNLPMLVW